MVLALSALSLMSCEDELLDQVNPNAITTGSFWQSEQDFEMAVNALYSALQFPAVSGGETVMNMMRSDLAGTESWYGIHLTYSHLTWTDASDFVKNRWSQLYIGIFRANQILYYVADADFLSDDQKTLIAAQARFLRGLNYFWLVHTYGEAVIHDSFATTDDEMHKPMSDRQTVVDNMIIPDLEYAMDNLPVKWGDEKLGRFTAGAAVAMLGKTYLYEEDWATAADYFKQIIDVSEKTNLYRLVDNYMDNFTIEGEYNDESILEVSFSDNYKEGISGNKVDDVGDVAGSEAISIAGNFASITGGGGYNTCLPTYWMQELFVAADSIDISNPVNIGKRYSARTYASIVVEFGDGEYYNAPLSGEGNKTNFNYGQGSKVKKWTNWYYLDSEDPATDARSGINFRHIRLADVYLMYAEAVLERDGDVTEALKYVEKVRERAGVMTLEQYMDANGNMIPVLDKSRFANGLVQHDLVPLTAESLLHHIRMVERPLELAYEGHRWYDLVRWGIVKEVFDARKVEEDKIKDILIGNYISKPDGSADEKIFPLYLNERVRPDWGTPASNYMSMFHDYFPVPSIEWQSNKNL